MQRQLFGVIEPRKCSRAGAAAAALAERRRAGEEAAAAARAQLAAYWNRQTAAINTILEPEDRFARLGQERADNFERLRLKQSKLDERRNKLSLMLYYEDLQHQEELKNLSIHAKCMRNVSYLDGVSTEAMRHVNVGIKAKEEERRKREAEIRLYHQWRNNSHSVQKYAEMQRNTALKSAWMEQIIEKEEEKRKEDERTRDFLKLRDEQIKKQIGLEREETLKKEHKMKELGDQLLQQIHEIHESEEKAKMLRSQLEAEQTLLNVLKHGIEMRESQMKQRAAARETVLGNMYLYARKIRERARDAELDVIADQKELETIQNAIESNAYKDDVNKNAWKEALANAHESLKRQRELEKLRQKRLDDAMDGEARAIYQKQNIVWKQEHLARQALLEDVLNTLKKQVDYKLVELKEKQRQNIIEREDMVDKVEKLKTELEQHEFEKEKQRQGFTKMAILQNQLKKIEMKEQEIVDKKQYNDDLHKATIEEEKLRNEIIKLQKEGSCFQNHRRQKLNW